MPEQIRKRDLHVALCDDDPIILERLKALTEQILSEKWNITLSCETSPRRILEDPFPFQIIVMDIQFPQCSGIDIARTLVAQNPLCRLIFVSGFPRYVSDVYDVPHMCLILKDQLEKQLPKFLLRAAEEATTRTAKTLSVRIKGEMEELPVCDICYLERREHITFIHLQSGRCLQTREKLDAILSRASAWQLCRCHISFVVNLQWVESMQKRDFVMQSGQTVPISRVNMRSAKESFFRYLRESV